MLWREELPQLGKIYAYGQERRLWSVNMGSAPDQLQTVQEQQIATLLIDQQGV